jgi:CobQ-like glutamine amidotransferase family enzyme
MATRAINPIRYEASKMRKTSEMNYKMDAAGGLAAPCEHPAATLRLGHLYPDQLNVYGDRGNILTFQRRCAWRGIALEIAPIGASDQLDPAAYDLLFIGGGQDREQEDIARDLRERKGPALRAAVEAGVPLLAVCGGYQLLARFYRPAEGPELQGAAIFDAWTIHPGKRVARCVGNVALRWNETTLIGFENHGGRTYLGANARPLGAVLSGFGNNGEDAREGCVVHNAYGTYLHGSLLPKNPHLADHLLALALACRYGASEAARLLPPLDDTLEWQAHDAMLRRVGVSPTTPRRLPIP